ncbi:MAG: phosphoribosyltransferase [Candidatus Bathyarchaeia archaeon]|jgi:predicted amidophosphoribosyltransferase
MELSRLDFGSLLAYSPRGMSAEIIHSRNIMIKLKTDSFVSNPQILMSQWIAQDIKRKKDSLPFASYFKANTTLVPTPKSSLMQPGTLWVPLRIANALVGMGLGKNVFPCLVRNKPVAKATSCAPSKRPLVADHYESLSVQKSLSNPDDLLLIDDVITRGATLLGAANCLADAFPQAEIRAFAAMRTISNSADFVKEYDPCIGEIELREIGDTLRRP